MADLQCERRDRQDFRAFKTLIATPGDLVAGFKLPANGYFYISTTSALGAITPLLVARTHTLSAPIGAANRVQPIGYLEKAWNVVKAGGALGTVSLFVRNGMGKLIKIGQG